MIGIADPPVGNPAITIQQRRGAGGSREEAQLLWYCWGLYSPFLKSLQTGHLEKSKFLPACPRQSPGWVRQYRRPTQLTRCPIVDYGSLQPVTERSNPRD